MGDKIRCLIAEDYKRLNQIYSNLLSYEDDMEVVGTAYSGREAFELAEKYAPDVILMDIEMEEACDGINTCSKILNINPKIKIVMLTCHFDENLVLSAYENGAVDYVLKTDSSAVILESVRSAYRNNSPIRPMIASIIRNEIKKNREVKNKASFAVKVLSMLTVSEIEVLRLLLKGKKQHEIAQARCIELSTVKTHVNSILKKFKEKKTSDIIKLLNEQDISDIINE
jgi:Response regulator containing a CheY-like receiver domain and an HTH DNA-binding domain